MHNPVNNNILIFPKYLLMHQNIQKQKKILHKCIHLPLLFASVSPEAHLAVLAGCGAAGAAGGRLLRPPRPPPPPASSGGPLTAVRSPVSLSREMRSFSGGIRGTCGESERVSNCAY